MNRVLEKGDDDSVADLQRITDNLWNELDGQIPRDRIYDVAASVAERFQDAKVKTYVPVFIRRFASARLRRELYQNRRS